MNIGDFVNYTGKLSGLTPQKNCQIKEFHGPNNIFNQQMALITKVPGWVAAAELEKAEQTYVIVIHKSSQRGYSLDRGYAVLDPDLGIIKPPEEFIEEWDGWLAGGCPPWVYAMGELAAIQYQFHAYWLY